MIHTNTVVKDKQLQKNPEYQKLGHDGFKIMNNRAKEWKTHRVITRAVCEALSIPNSMWYPKLIILHFLFNQTTHIILSAGSLHQKTDKVVFVQRGGEVIVRKA